MDINTIALYAMYIVALIGDLVAGYFKLIDPLVVSSLFSLIVGHFLGLQVLPPSVAKELSITGGGKDVPLVPQKESTV